MADETTEKKEFSVEVLNDRQKRDYEFVKGRIPDLQKVRADHYGVNLNSLWDDADRDYVPHRLKTGGTKATVTDEDKGWRGKVVRLGASDWQSDNAQSNPFIKIQIALSILIDQNPSGVFTPYLKKYQSVTSLIKQLYGRSWEFAKSKGQLKLFVFNLAKYGWAAARTYPLKLTRKVRTLVDYNEEDPSLSTYEEKEVVEYNDIFRENLDVRNVWIDDMAKPNNPFSVRDWTWRKVYDYDDLKTEFGKYTWFKYVKPQSGITTETLLSKASKKLEGKNLVEVYFYENKPRDLFMVLMGGVDGVPVILEPLPIEESNGAKKLSLWQTYWNLRHSESPFGVGLYEAMRYDQALQDRVSNMSIDQLTLAIYKMFFYQGTQNLQETGEIVIKPGVGKQVIDPKSITWLQVPGPGQEVIQWLEIFKKRLDEASGITDPLTGEVTGKTAFELAQAKESALKRLKNPFDNILEALNDEAYLTICLMQLIYSVPETYEIADQALIEAYLKDVQGDEDLYEREESVGEDGTPTSTFKAKVYREFPLSLDKDDKGNLIETNQTQFFRVKPKYLKWEGVVNIKSQSILTPSKQVDKALDLEFYNMFIPLLTTVDQERMMAMQSGKQNPNLDDLPHGKAIKELAKLYDKDPKDVLPDVWFAEQAPESEQSAQPTSEEGSLFVPGGTPPEQPVQPVPETEAPKAVEAATLPTSQPQGIVGKVMARLTQPFRKA